MASTRQERDSFGPIEVPSDRYWAAQTQRSLQNFAIGAEKMPAPLIRALILIKRCAADANRELGELDPALAGAIVQAADEALAGRFDGHFPLSVWQTGSGTQTNMNVNEVLANRASEILGAPLGTKGRVHPNDHVNRGQSSNDTFPTAMHVAGAVEIARELLPRLEALAQALEAKAEAFADLVKIGRTHLQDATPVTLGQEFSGYATQVRLGIARIAAASEGLNALAQGGTAVGTGLNAHPRFGALVAEKLAAATPAFPAGGKPVRGAGQSRRDGVRPWRAGGAGRRALQDRQRHPADGLGAALGLGEISLPENEPGSSIMPGKVNPTQAEALTMVCARVIGNGTTIAFAGSQGHFELNVFKPVIADAFLQSVRLLGDAAESFRVHCVEGIAPNEARLTELMGRSLMLVTALAPEIGYDKAAAIAKGAHISGATLREAALQAGVSAELFDRVVDPRRMLGPDEG